MICFNNGDALTICLYNPAKRLPPSYLGSPGFCADASSTTYTQNEYDYYGKTYVGGYSNNQADMAKKAADW